MKHYLIYCIIVLCFLIGCSAGDTTDTAGANQAATISKDAPVGSTDEIPLGKHTATALLHNPASNELTLIRRKKHTYSLYVLETGDVWSPCQTSWTVEEGSSLDNFVFGPSGVLYAVRKEPQKKKNPAQTFLRLNHNGKFTPVTLQDLDESAQEIKNVQFSGTTLAFTFSNRKVKFYNIKEGAALGAANIKGTPGKSAFQNHNYITVSWKNSRGVYTLDYTDIRFGENIRTLSLKPAAISDSYFLTNYRDSIYLLCGDGIYGGPMKGKNLSLMVDYASLNLPSSCRVASIIAARDDVVYVTWLDEKKKLHLQRCR